MYLSTSSGSSLDDTAKRYKYDVDDLFEAWELKYVYV